jgi:DNA-binding SARP family transcriptional activator
MHLYLATSARLVGADGRSVPLAPQDAALLAWLALEGPTPRNRLAQLLWPDSDSEAARNALRQRLFQMKKLLGHELVSGSTMLALAPGVSHDLYEADSVLGDAVHSFGAELLGWLEQQRGRRRARLRQSLIELSELAARAGDHADAISHANELLALDPLSEAAHRRLIRLHYLAGDRAASLLAFDRCERVLKDEVGTQPSAETLALLQTVQSALAVPAPSPRAAAPASVLRPPRMVGRADALGAGVAAWEREQVLSVIGEAGMGKSRLLQELAAGQPGAVLAQARPGDAVVPFAAVARLLRAVIDRAPHSIQAVPRTELARLLPEVGAVAPAMTAATLGDAQRLALQRSVLALLRGARAAGVSALLLDDLHFADEASLDLLQVLARPGAVEGMRWGLAQRPAEGSPVIAALHDTLLEEQCLVVLRLAPLSVAQLGELVGSLGLDGIDVAALAEQLHRHTGGNPLFALETLRQAWVEQRIGRGALPRPVSVAQLIERRLARLSPAAVRLARCAAVAGQDFSTELATRVLAVRAIDLADAWAELTEAQVLHDSAFAHDLILDATLASVPAPIARHLHGEVAACLVEHGGEPGRLALHWQAAQRWAPAGAAFVQAAERARDASRPAEQTALLADAAQCFASAGESQARFDALLERARLLSANECSHGAHEAVTALFDAAGTDLQRLQAYDVQLLLAVTRLEVPQALRIGTVALDAARRLGREDIELRLAVSLSGALCDARRAADAVALLDGQAGRLERIAGPEQQWEYWSARGIALDYADRLRDAGHAWGRAEHIARAMARDDMLWKTLANAASTQAKMGRVGLAASAGLQARQLAAAHGDPVTIRIRMMHTTLAHRLRDLGQYTEALALLEDAHAGMREGGSAAEKAGVEHRLAQLFQQLGQPARAQALLAAEHDGLPLAVATIRQVHRADLAHQLGGDGLPLIREALAMMPDPDDVYHRIASLFATRIVGPDEGEAMATGLAAWASARERFGVALAGHVRAAACALAQGAAARALPQVEAALNLARDHQPDSFYLPEAWLVAARVHVALGRADEAARMARTGRDWVMAVHDAQVPAAFQASFLQRNAVNRELLELAATLPADR